MAGPGITDNPAKSHHHPARCGLNLPHPPALMKLMEGISDMLFLLSLTVTVISLMALLPCRRRGICSFFPPSARVYFWA